MPLPVARNIYTVLLFNLTVINFTKNIEQINREREESMTKTIKKFTTVCCELVATECNDESNKAFKYLNGV